MTILLFLKSSVKVIINSTLFRTISESLNFLSEFLEKYNAILPFSSISLKLAELLPFQILTKRRFFRKKYFLPEENYVINENAPFYDNEKKYDEILLSVLEELENRMMTGFFILFSSFISILYSK